MLTKQDLYKEIHYFTFFYKDEFLKKNNLNNVSINDIINGTSYDLYINSVFRNRKQCLQFAVLFNEGEYSFYWDFLIDNEEFVDILEKFNNNMISIEFNNDQLNTYYKNLHDVIFIQNSRTTPYIVRENLENF